MTRSCIRYERRLLSRGAFFFFVFCRSWLFQKPPGTKRDIYYLCEGDPTVSVRVNVSASRLILRLKIIRGLTVVTTREESWGAYLSGTFDGRLPTTDFLFTSKLHGSLHVPWEFQPRSNLFFSLFPFFSFGRSILSPFIRETSSPDPL